MDNHSSLDVIIKHYKKSLDKVNRMIKWAYITLLITMSAMFILLYALATYDGFLMDELIPYVFVLLIPLLIFFYVIIINFTKHKSKIEIMYTDYLRLSILENSSEEFMEYFYESLTKRLFDIDYRGNNIEDDTERNRVLKMLRSIKNKISIES